jgi:hypothetical protein
VIRRSPSAQYRAASSTRTFDRRSHKRALPIGHLDEFDGENYGGEGAFVGAQAGFLWGRPRRWGRAAVELQLSVPLFGERPNKPGDYVFSFVTLGVRLFL